MSEPEPRHSAVKPARGPRYGGRGSSPGALGGRAGDSNDPAYRRPGADASSGPPPDAPSNALGSAPFHASNALQRNRTYAVISALPVMMLVFGLAWFYLGERRQSGGAPIAAQSVTLEGRFDGLSRVGSSGSGRHYLWLQTQARRRGVRLRPIEAARLRAQLQAGERIVIEAAPSVDGSSTRWLWRLVRDGQILLDETARLR